jgi:hypothetical protein
MGIPQSVEYLSVYSDDEIQSQLVEPAALGHLNGDGRADSAVILTIDPNGSGTFY